MSDAAAHPKQNLEGRKLALWVSGVGIWMLALGLAVYHVPFVRFLVTDPQTHVWKPIIRSCVFCAFPIFLVGLSVYCLDKERPLAAIVLPAAFFLSLAFLHAPPLAAFYVCALVALATPMNTLPLQGRRSPAHRVLGYLAVVLLVVEIVVYVRETP